MGLDYNKVSSSIMLLSIVAKAIKEMMSAAKDIAGRKDQAYVVGEGLSNVGVDMLGEKLAKMTIGEIKDMLDLRNLDPVIIVKLFGQLKDLAKALVSIYLKRKTKYAYNLYL